jgi:hypothetical protein
VAITTPQGAITGPSIYTKSLNFLNTVVVGNGTSRWYPDSPLTLANVYVTAGTAPVGGNLSLRINIDGTASAYANLTAGSYKSAVSSINRTVSTTDYITVDVVTNSGAQNATLTFTYTRN